VRVDLKTIWSALPGSMKTFLRQLPVLTELAAARRRCAELEAELAAARTAPTVSEAEPCSLFPPGHYHSPLPDIEDIERRANIVFAPPPRTLPAIDLREAEQLALLEKLAAFYPELPWTDGPSPDHRYHFRNGSYEFSDAICSYSMLRHLQPRRYLEVGSGYSSCVALDVNDLFLGGRMKMTFIEPYPEGLFVPLLRNGDAARMTLVRCRLQEADLVLFRQLEAGDVLFIDSTHVSKVDSDVNRIFFEILPALATGVYVHFHDIFYPFEYPRAWIYAGLAWQEDYLLRAFLEYNPAFEVVLFNTFLEHFHDAWFREHMPLCLENPGGSIWLRKIKQSAANLLPTSGTQDCVSESPGRPGAGPRGF
jgi:hypothetical protein